MNFHRLVTVIGTTLIQIRPFSSAWQISKANVFQCPFQATALKSTKCNNGGHYPIFCLPKFSSHLYPQLYPTTTDPKLVPTPVSTTVFSSIIQSVKDAQILYPTSKQHRQPCFRLFNFDRYKQLRRGPVIIILTYHIPSSVLFYNAVTITNSVPGALFEGIDFKMDQHSYKGDDRTVFTLLDDPKLESANVIKVMEKAVDVNIVLFAEESLEKKAKAKHTFWQRT